MRVDYEIGPTEEEIVRNLSIQEIQQLRKKFNP